MICDVQETLDYAKWFAKVRDERLRATISRRVDQLLYGNPGDVRPVGEGVSELRIHYGAGYRIYFTRCGQTLIMLLCAGDKKTQDKDIRRAKLLAANLEDRT